MFEVAAVIGTIGTVWFGTVATRKAALAKALYAEVQVLNAENQLVTGRLIAARKDNEGYSRKVKGLRMIIKAQRGKISDVKSERDAIQAKYALATKRDAKGRVAARDAA